MKTFNNFKKIVLIMTLTIGFVSCEKSELDSSDNTEAFTQEEGFKSTTGNSNSKLENISPEKPVFHMTYEGSLSKKEANTKFEVDAARFMKKYKNNNRAVSTEWFYSISTGTGTQTYNDTNANVWGKVTFQTDKGYRDAGWVKLDNPGNERGRGDWDFYIFRTTYPGEAVSWVETECATLTLEGTDGWFVTHFNAQVYESIQTLPASGNSGIISMPNIWLDNNTIRVWDSYTNCNDVGRLNF
jgi:hypothetical protein